MIRSIVRDYFAKLYQRTMRSSYDEALDRIAKSLAGGGRCLDCGAGDGTQLMAVRQRALTPEARYVAVEWDASRAARAHQEAIQVVRADLNENLPFADQSFQCVFALSVLEHLSRGCRFLQEAHRILVPGGRLIILTPNLSAWFNVILLALGRMPSTGPHPDSAHLVESMTPIRFRDVERARVEDRMPVDRHLVVFTFKALEYYLRYIGFHSINGIGYGLYPWPRSLQPLVEHADPSHCHQMLFDCLR